MSADEDRQNFFAELERRGEASVRADLATANFGSRTALATEWVNKQELERAHRAEQREGHIVRAAEKSADAAERSASAAEGSQESAERSEKWAKVAAAAAAVAAICAVAALVGAFLVH
jgi:hypothetical protein